MVTLEQLTAFFGWCSLINIGLLSLSSVVVFAMRDRVVSIHHRLTGVPEADLPREYFRYLANYKIVVLTFNVVPYVALRLMA